MTREISIDPFNTFKIPARCTECGASGYVSLSVQQGASFDVLWSVDGAFHTENKPAGVLPWHIHELVMEAS